MAFAKCRVVFLCALLVSGCAWQRVLSHLIWLLKLLSRCELEFHSAIVSPLASTVLAS